MSANIKLGQRVVIRGKADDFGPGTVRFVGPTKINPVGRNDGSVNGDRYFTCAPTYGLIVKEALAQIIESPPTVQSSPKPERYAAPAPAPAPAPEQPKPTPAIHAPVEKPAAVLASSSVPSTPTKPGNTATPLATPTRSNSTITSRLSIGELAALDSPSATPTKSKEITFSQPLANLVRTQTTRIRALATNNTIGALKPHLDELAISQDLVEAELRKVRLRNAELEKRSTQLEKDIETATLQLRDVLVGNLSTEEKLLQEREKLMEEQKTQGKIKGEAQTFQQQLTFTQDEAKKSRAQLDELGSQLSQRDLRLKQLESTLESEKTTLTQQLEDVQQKYSKQVEELQQKQAKQVEELNKAKEEALESLRKEYEAKLVAAAEVNAAAIASLEENHKQILAEVENKEHTHYTQLEQFVAEQKRRIHQIAERRARIFTELQAIDAEERSTLESMVKENNEVVPVSDIVDTSKPAPAPLEVVPLVAAPAVPIVNDGHDDFELKFDDEDLPVSRAAQEESHAFHQTQPADSDEEDHASSAKPVLSVEDGTAGLVSLDDLDATFDDGPNDHQPNGGDSDELI